ncbi:hypothetical protein [Virgibacillus salexigens]|uniref:GOLD domain-containing protein n=1 Tax=Virgibacillus kapii TaxID=1638645 RepID=A0ABQ2DXS1_9BACI|nr:hypothetical protein [Virgibacillus kapii]GGJ77702.1 hypothetical protein GCM10007111_44100 [Virgibacillus kapii]
MLQISLLSKSREQKGGNKKNILISFLTILMIFSIMAVPSNKVEAAETTACTNVDISIYYMNDSTKQITFRVTGTPGNEVQFAIHDALADPYDYVTYFDMPSSGVKYISRDFSNYEGLYRAYVYQYSPCSRAFNILFW